MSAQNWRTPRGYQERRWLCLADEGCLSRPIIIKDNGDARCREHADSEDVAVAAVVQEKLD